LGVDIPVTEEVISYPNPTKGTVTVEFKSQSKEGTQIYIHDILGKTVYSESFEHVDNFNKQITMPIGSSSGVYFLTIVDGDKRTVKKIILN